jgi:hypothetical protein
MSMRVATRTAAVGAVVAALAAPASAQVVVQPAVFPPVVNPWVQPWANPWVNPWAVNPWVRPAPWLVNPAPPLAVRQPGLYLFKGPDLYVNPVAGSVVRPLTGVARLGDGTTFFRVPGTGVVNAFGQVQTGSETYFSPRFGTYYTPSTGVVFRPGW